MKIIGNEEENNENKKGSAEIDNLGGRDESQGSGNALGTKILFGEVSSTQYRGKRKPRKSVAHSAVKLSGVLSEDALDDGNTTMEVGQDQVPAVTPRGRGRPRKSTLVADAISPLAKASPMPSPGRGRPRKDTSVIKSPSVKDSPPLSERKGRGRPRKTVGESDVIKASEKSDEKENVDATDLKGKADSVPRRGRGRPRKNFGSFSASTSLIGDKTSSTPRRGKGHPRKNLKNIGATALMKGRHGHQNDSRKLGAIQLLAQALTKHGRGRPRKGTGIKDAVQLLQKDPVLSKPGRGRPPKSIKRIFAMKLLAKAMGVGCQDEATKSISITDVTKALTDATDTSRKGRGRPKKVVAKAADTISDEDPAVTPRGRGRPRKSFGTPDATLSPGKVSAVTPTTPRGRVVSAVTPTTPRGRGRPRKSIATVEAEVPLSKGSFSGAMTEEL